MLFLEGEDRPRRGRGRGGMRRGGGARGGFRGFFKFVIIMCIDMEEASKNKNRKLNNQLHKKINKLKKKIIEYKIQLILKQSFLSIKFNI